MPTPVVASLIDLDRALSAGRRDDDRKSLGATAPGDLFWIKVARLNVAAERGIRLDYASANLLPAPKRRDDFHVYLAVACSDERRRNTTVSSSVFQCHILVSREALIDDADLCLLAIGARVTAAGGCMQQSDQSYRCFLSRRHFVTFRSMSMQHPHPQGAKK